MNVFEIVASLPVVASVAAALLGLLGAWPVAQDRTAATLPIAGGAVLALAVGPVLLPWLPSSLVATVGAESLTALLAAFVAALAAAFVLTRAADLFDSPDARATWGLVTGVGLVALVGSLAEGGAFDGGRWLASTDPEFGAGRAMTVFVLAAATGFFVAANGDVLRAVVVDREMASAAGVRVARWELGVAVWIGVCLSVVVGGAGATVGLATLALAPMAARAVARTLTALMWTAPLLAFAATVSAHAWAPAAGVPPGPLTALLLSVATGVTWLLPSRRR